MKPIPRAARLVVKEIRKHVKRPKTLPKLYQDIGNNGALRWMRADKFFKHFEQFKYMRRETCPMGMLPYANENTPIYLCDFDDDPPLTEKAIISFWNWFDGLAESDAAEAMDAIWPA